MRSALQFQAVVAADQQISSVDVFCNPFMKTAIFTYRLGQPATVQIQLFRNAGRRMVKVRDLVGLMGNPGGRNGINKVLWDGMSGAGQKVPFGRYTAVFWVDGTRQTSQILVSF
ncbi:MAG: hypothetical protein AAB066_00395 [Candidatus Margulisiibacteriota bacterium]|jgi:hypothetical protein